MMKHFTLPKRKRLEAGALIMLMLSTGCRTDAKRSLPRLHLCAVVAENSYLNRVFFCQNGDSIMNYALADYNRNKYYMFIATLPGEVKFEHYLAAYAKQKYKLILVDCGSNRATGACGYNKQMATLLSKIKPFGLIYLEAKSCYNKTLLKPAGV